MSAWIESHQTLRDHPKKDELAEALFAGMVPDDVADYAAVGVLHQLWWWALDYAQDGDLSGFSDRQIAKACRWRGETQVLVNALITSGFVTEDRQLHDWYDYAGKLIERRESDRSRKSAKRVADRQAYVRGTSDGSPQDVRSLARAHTEPNLTVKNVKNSSSSADADDGFHEFWTKYPRKVARAEAHKRWAKLTADDRVLATVAAGNLDGYVAATSTDLKFVPHPGTFIGPKRTFEDWCKGWPDGYGNNGTKKKRLQCACGTDLTYDEDGLHCPSCGDRVAETAPRNERQDSDHERT